jgi:subtilisin family serine protease
MAKFCLAIAFAALAWLNSQLAQIPDPHTAPLPPSASAELLVIVNADVSAVAAGALAERHALTLSDSWRIVSLDRDCYVFSGGAAELAAALEPLAAEPAVESVQTTRVFHVAGAPEQLIDPYVNLQHSLVSARIDEAQQLSTGAGVKVAIIDTGLDRTHYDLRGRVETALNFVDADQTIEIVEFHATAVAGIIGAAAHNGRGIVGIAPDARLFSLRACWESIPGTSRGQCSSFSLARALDWAITNDMKVVNMSLQGQYDPLVSRLITRAIQRGLVVVAATDLGDEVLSFPASMREVIAVSYHDPLRTMDYTRNAGKVFVAPGEEVLTTMPDNTYDFVSGSSFASAHVAGIVALLAEPVPDIDAHTVRAVLRSSLRIANWDVTIDACTALGTVTGAENCRPPPP